MANFKQKFVNCFDSNNNNNNANDELDLSILTQKSDLNSNWHDQPSLSDPSSIGDKRANVETDNSHPLRLVIRLNQTKAQNLTGLDSNNNSNDDNDDDEEEEEKEAVEVGQVDNADQHYLETMSYRTADDVDSDGVREDDDDHDNFNGESRLVNTGNLDDLQDLVGFCIASEAQTFMDPNQRQIRRVLNEALSMNAGLVGLYMPSPGPNDDGGGLGGGGSGSGEGGGGCVFNSNHHYCLIESDHGQRNQTYSYNNSSCTVERHATKVGTGTVSSSLSRCTDDPKSNLVDPHLDSPMFTGQKIKHSRKKSKRKWKSRTGRDGIGLLDDCVLDQKRPFIPLTTDFDHILNPIRFDKDILPNSSPLLIKPPLVCDCLSYENSKSVHHQSWKKKKKKNETSRLENDRYAYYVFLLSLSLLL